MKSILDWSSNHEVLVTWLLTAILTFLLKPRTAEEYEKLPPRLAGLLRLVGGLGIDVPNVGKALTLIRTGKHPPPSAPVPIQINQNGAPQ